MCHMKLRPIAYATLIGVTVIGTACSILKDPQLPPDLAKVESCIQQAAESGVTSPIAIAITCAPGEEQFVADFLTALLQSSWAQSHPTLVSALQNGLTTFKLRLTDGGGQ